MDRFSMAFALCECLRNQNVYRQLFNPFIVTIMIIIVELSTLVLQIFAGTNVGNFCNLLQNYKY